jgi:hypothetical protein
MQNKGQVNSKHPITQQNIPETIKTPSTGVQHQLSSEGQPTITPPNNQFYDSGNRSEPSLLDASKIIEHSINT